MVTKPVIPLTPVGEERHQLPRLPLNGKHFFIWTIGCQMNEADSAKVASMLQEVGYQPTADEEEADIIVLNSCVVRQAAEDRVAGTEFAGQAQAPEARDAAGADRLHGDQATGKAEGNISAR